MGFFQSLFGANAPKTNVSSYSGMKPPAIDVNGNNYLRGTQDELQKIVQDRAQGIGVGYDPSWMKNSVDVLNSNMARREGDQLRNSAGALSASGLGGNPRAFEATSGRIQRDNTTDLSNAIKALDIQNMERSNQERDVNTGRLQQLNASNFGQENERANFDRGVWGEEQNLGLRANQLQDSNYWNQVSQENQMVNDMAKTGVALAMPVQGTNINTNGSGNGIAPNTYGASASALSSSQNPYSIYNAPMVKTKLQY